MQLHMLLDIVARSIYIVNSTALIRVVTERCQSDELSLSRFSETPTSAKTRRCRRFRDSVYVVEETVCRRNGSRRWRNALVMEKTREEPEETKRSRIGGRQKRRKTHGGKREIGKIGIAVDGH